MMLFKYIGLLALPLLAVATPGGKPTTTTKPPVTTTVTVTTTTTATPVTSCSTGPIQCCDTLTTAGSAAGSSILALLGIVVQDLTVPIGITCSPVTVVGVSGTSCSAQTVCCENNSFKGVVAIGCAPITL